MVTNHQTQQVFYIQLSPGEAIWCTTTEKRIIFYYDNVHNSDKSNSVMFNGEWHDRTLLISVVLYPTLFLVALHDDGNTYVDADIMKIRTKDFLFSEYRYANISKSIKCIINKIVIWRRLP